MYKRLLLILAVSIAVLAIVLSSMLYFNYAASSADILNTLNMKVLSQISYSLTYMDEISRNYCQSFYLDNNVNAFIWANQSNVVSIQKSILSISSQALSNQYIHSVYVYNGTLDMFVNVTTGAFSDSGDFFDKEVSGYTGSDISNKPLLEPIARIIPSYGNSSVMNNVYTYLFYDVSYDPYKLNGMVVLNVKTDWLRNIISSQYSNTNALDTEILVLDQNGEIMNGKSKDLFRENISEREYVRKILNSDKVSGTFGSTIDGRRFLVSFVSSTNLKWKFISLTPYEKAFAKISRMGYISIVLCLFVLLIGLVYSYFASKWLYSPLDLLIKRINRDIPADDKNEDFSDEVTFISTAFTSIYGKANKLERLYRDQSVLLKEEYYRSLLLGTSQYSPEDMRVKLRDGDIRVRLEAPLFLFIIRIDNYKNFVETFSEKERVIIKYTISGTICELLNQDYCAETINMGEDHFAVLMNVPDARMANNAMVLSVAGIVKTLQADFEDQLHLTVSASVGYVIEDPSMIHGLYQNTLVLSLYRFTHGHGCIVTPAVLDSIKAGDIELTASKDKILLEALRIGRLDRATEVLDDIYIIISKYPYEKIKAYLMYLTFTIYNSFIHTSRENGTTLSLNSILSNIGNLETLDETKSAFLHLFKNLTAKTEGNKADSLVHSIIAILNQQYSNSAICLNGIADSLHMSPAYVGRIFREVTRKSVSEYLMDIRMEQVKKQLDSGNAHINDILERAGLEKSNYFYTTFKKYYGVTLSEYKKSISQS